MKYCTQCGNKYPNEFDFCTVDGSKLADRNEAETLKMKPKSEDPLQAVRITGPGTFELAKVDYIIKKVWVDEGNVFHFITNTNDANIHVKEIVEESFTSGSFPENKTKENRAMIQVNTLIGRMRGGNETIHVPRSIPPAYIVPVKGLEEEPRSIFCFYAHGKISLLFRIFVEEINIHHRRVELNIGYLWYGGD